jgi:hypothetical protein
LQYQWQVEQFPPEHVPQLVPELAGEPSLEAMAKVLNSFETSSPLQAGQDTSSLFDRMSTSNTDLHSLQEYSYSGMEFLLWPVDFQPPH